MSASPWFVYLLECADGTLYTGVTNDVEARLQKHNEGKGAKYTRGRTPLVLLATLGPMSRSESLKTERAIKRKKRANKLKTFSLV